MAAPTVGVDGAVGAERINPFPTVEKSFIVLRFALCVLTMGILRLATLAQDDRKVVLRFAFL